MTIEMVPDSPQEKKKQAEAVLANVSKQLKIKLTDNEASFTRLYFGVDQLVDVRCQGNITQSMKSSSMPCVGSDENICQVGRRILLRLGNTLELSLIAKGASDDKLADVLIEGLTAEKQHTYQGSIVDTSPDNQERRKTAMDILKIRGVVGKDSKQGTKQHPDVIARSIDLVKGKDGIFADPTRQDTDS